MTGQLADERAGFRGGGDYLHSRWDLHLVGDTLTEPYGVMSLHELFHADLDETTNYGRLLSAYSGLASAAGAGSLASRTFSTLREWCRISHETYATYLSLLSFAGPRFDDLSQYASGRYLDYLHMGEQLTGDLRSRFLRQQVAVACLQLCLQAPVVAIALDRGLEVFRPRDLPADHRPDVRLRVVAGFVSRPGFWPALLGGLPALTDHPDGAAALRNEDTDERFGELLGSSDDGLGTALVNGCYSALASALAEPPWSLPALGHHEFAAHSARLSEACRVITGGRPGGPSAADGLLDPGIGAALGFERERNVVRPPQPARLFKVPVSEWLDRAEPADPVGDRLSVVVARQAERLLQQFTWGAADQRYLEALGRKPLCAVRAPLAFADDDDEEIIAFVPLGSAGDVAEMAAAGRVVACVSSAVLTTATLDRDLFDTLVTATELSVLLDTSPFRLIDLWAQRPIAGVLHGQLLVEDGDGRWSIFWMRPGIDPPHIHFAPCSVMMTAAIMLYLERAGDRHGFPVEQVELDVESQERLAPVIGQLLRLEPWFDFLAPLGGDEEEKVDSG